MPEARSGPDYTPFARLTPGDAQENHQEEARWVTCARCTSCRPRLGGARLRIGSRHPVLIVSGPLSPTSPASLPLQLLAPPQQQP